MKVVFDICGTLYDSNTTLDFCQWRVKNIWHRCFLIFLRSKLVAACNKFALFFWKTDLIPVRKIFIKTLRGTPKSTLYQESVAFVNLYLKDKVRAETLSILKEFNSSEVIFVSGTLDCIAYSVAKHFHIPTFYSSQLKYDQSGICSGDLMYDLLGNKHRLFDAIDVVVTDNLDDVELCKMAQNAYIVTRSKHRKFWLSQGFTNMRLLEV